jgi:hypothetical protein
MHKVPGTYWKPDSELAVLLWQETAGLNPTPHQDSLARLGSLRQELVGGILLVTRQYMKDGISSAPYITIVAAPSLATLGPFSVDDPPGITYSDLWDDLVLASYGISSLEGLHYSLMAATEGFSRAIKLPGAVDLLTESQPLFFPLGKQIPPHQL